MYVRRKIDDRIRARTQAKARHTMRGRGAFTIVELIGTVILLGVVFTCSISVLIAVARERKSTEQRQHALQYANNVLEHATTLPLDGLTAGKQQIPAASPELLVVLPELDQTLELSEPAADGARQFAVSIRWKNQQGRLVAPVHLVTWVYPPAEVQP